MKRIEHKKEGERMKKRRLLFLLVGLNIVDLVTTVYGFSIGGVELNPLFPGTSFASKESLIIKICLPFIYSALFTVTHRLCEKEHFSKGLRLLNFKLTVLVGYYVIVISNNLFGIMTTGGQRTLKSIVGEFNVL